MNHLGVVRDLIEKLTPHVLSKEEVGIFFQHDQLWRYKAAFTHASVDPIHNYEILELKGDSVLNYVMSIYVRKRFPDIVNHVWLTNAKQALVSSRYLSKIGNSLGLCDHLIASGKVMRAIRDDTTEREKIIDDMFEAILGAIVRVADLALYDGSGNVIAYHIIKRVFDEFTIEMKWTDLVHPITIIKEIYDSIPDVEGVKVEWKYGAAYTQHKNEEYDEPWRTTIYFPYRLQDRRENVIATGVGCTETESLMKAIHYALQSKVLRNKINYLIPNPFDIGTKMFRQSEEQEPGISQWHRYLQIIQPQEEIQEVQTPSPSSPSTPSSTPSIPGYFAEFTRQILDEGGMSPSYTNTILSDVLLMRELACSCVCTSPHKNVQMIHELSLYEGVGIIDCVVVDYLLASLSKTVCVTEKVVNEHKQNTMSQDNFNIIVPKEFKEVMSRMIDEFNFSPQVKGYAKERDNIMFKAFLGCLSSIIDRIAAFGIGYCILNTYLSGRLSTVELTRDESIGSLTLLFQNMGWGSIPDNYEYSMDGSSPEQGYTHTIKIFGTPHGERVVLGEGAGRNKKQALQIAAKNSLCSLRDDHNIRTVHQTKTTSSHLRQESPQRQVGWRGSRGRRIFRK